MEACEVGRADNTSVIDHLGDHKFRLRMKTPRWQVCQVRRSHRIKEQIPGDGKATTNHEELWIEHCTE
jgi:hypothetical protein